MTLSGGKKRSRATAAPVAVPAAPAAHVPGDAAPSHAAPRAKRARKGVARDVAAAGATVLAAPAADGATAPAAAAAAPVAAEGAVGAAGRSRPKRTAVNLRQALAESNVTGAHADRGAPPASVAPPPPPPPPPAAAAAEGAAAASGAAAADAVGMAGRSSRTKRSAVIIGEVMVASAKGAAGGGGGGGGGGGHKPRRKAVAAAPDVPLPLAQSDGPVPSAGADPAVGDGGGSGIGGGGGGRGGRVEPLDFPLHLLEPYPDSNVFGWYKDTELGENTPIRILNVREAIVHSEEEIGWAETRNPYTTYYSLVDKRQYSSPSRLCVSYSEVKPRFNFSYDATTFSPRYIEAVARHKKEFDAAVARETSAAAAPSFEEEEEDVDMVVSPSQVVVHVERTKPRRLPTLAPGMQVAVLDKVFKERGALIEATIAYIKDREIVLDNGLEPDSDTEFVVLGRKGTDGQEIYRFGACRRTPGGARPDRRALAEEDDRKWKAEVAALPALETSLFGGGKRSSKR